MLILDFTDYQWESQTRRYRDRSSGRFLSRQAIAQLTQLRISQVTQDLQRLGDSLLSSEITLRQWQVSFAESLKILHTQQFLLGVGGEAQIQESDYQAISDELENQFKYLRNFATELTEGKVSPAQFKVRSGMYAQATKVSYFRGEKESAKRSGFDGAIRVLGETDNHCDDCVRYAAMGMVPIDKAVVPCTKCKCLGNCLCSLLYGKLEDAIARNKSKSESLLDQVKQQISELSPRQIKELSDDYKLSISGSTDTLKQRFIDFIGTKNQIQLSNISAYIQQVKARVK